MWHNFSANVELYAVYGPVKQILSLLSYSQVPKNLVSSYNTARFNVLVVRLCGNNWKVSPVNQVNVKRKHRKAAENVGTLKLLPSS
jgi:hypothetical protein